MGDILVNVGFDVGSSSPIDSRTLKDTIDERDALMHEGKVYENLKVYCKDTQKEYRWTGTEWETVVGSSGDLTYYQEKTDNTLDTTDKTITGAINEVNGNLLDTVGFSADYKNIILNRKSGLNPYTIPISAIINNASLTELKDIDSTDIGNGKTLVYDSSIQKHKYVNTTGTDEFVKMDSTTDANYLSNLIDKSTVVNDNGVLKVKKLDGQEVTITEINYLKGLTMNVMDLVNAFANGGVKVLNTPLNTASELDTMDRTSFIDGISYIVYVLADENHSGAKTTYLCTKTSTTFFGNADSQRNFTTNPIDLATEVTGKLGTSNIDVDSLWTLLTINDTYKTLTTNNEIFGTHGAKAMYDELTTAIGKKANTSDIPTLAGLKRRYNSIEELNTIKKKSLVLVNGEDNTQKVLDTLDAGEVLSDYFSNSGSTSRFGINASLGTSFIITFEKNGNGYARIIANSATSNTVLVRYHNANKLSAWQELATMDKIGSTDISSIGNGTVTGAIDTINTSLESYSIPINTYMNLNHYLTIKTKVHDMNYSFNISDRSGNIYEGAFFSFNGSFSVQIKKINNSSVKNGYILGFRQYKVSGGEIYLVMKVSDYNHINGVINTSSVLKPNIEILVNDDSTLWNKGTDIVVKEIATMDKVTGIPNSDLTNMNTKLIQLENTVNQIVKKDIPKTTLTPVFPSEEFRVASGGVAINYVVKNGWCNVNFAFNLASAPTCSWTSIATGLPKPANNVNILLTDESGKINRNIAIKINSNGLVASRIPVTFTAVDWWTGNISYPVAES